ncbi:hypothetical protein K402DRAFT_420352 [Aulographum hederae CBS 113979]|uniref:Zn(2)-C6 fungal-type domain-containing protein n=1 Tax=Aulographum hederae CBS 113979 TaxID=1176131 RepID=A0A6G1H2V2_9PEZI|nr:hypothetical protein K402DRAFT_420352 [Aulographum hederae CBS 113979]
MVFCGKPSKGCAECRSRKTKCDQTQPSCGQCRRSSRVCSGYRDFGTLLFRDQTEEVARKIKQKGFREENRPPSLKLTKRDSSSISPSTRPSAPEDYTLNNLSRLRLVTPVREQAINYFFRNYVASDDKFQTGYLDRILGTFRDDDRANSILYEVSECIGMAALSSRYSDTALMTMATTKHGAVLRRTALLLQNTDKATLDQTVVTVILLALYETVSCDRPQSMRAWVKHIEGATALVVARGKQQLQSELGRWIVSYVTLQAIIDSLQRRKLVPPCLLELGDIPDRTSIQEAQGRLFAILVKLAALRELEDQSDNICAIFLQAQAIEAELVQWPTNLPAEYLYTAVMVDPADLESKRTQTFSGHYHVYSSFWISSIWNTYRCAHMLIVESTMRCRLRTLPLVTFSPCPTLVTCLQNMDWRNIPDEVWSAACATDALLQLRCAQMERLAEDLCASIPFHFEAMEGGWTNLPRSAMGHGLLWPLYVAATMINVRPAMRAWVISQLNRLADLDIRQALALADVFRVKKEITLWDRDDVVGVDGDEQW